MVSANGDAPGVGIGPIRGDFVAGSEHKLGQAAQFPPPRGRERGGHFLNTLISLTLPDAGTAIATVLPEAAR